MVNLTTPAPGRPVTSPYGWRRHPVTLKLRMHNGIDFGGVFLVLVAAPGTVVSNRYDAELGWVVTIEHSPTLRTQYAHGATRSPLQVGASVDRGDIVFTSGETGLTTGPHLHFAMWVRRALVWMRTNPAPYLTEPTPEPHDDGDDDMPRVIRNTADRKLAPKYHGDVAIVSPTLLVRKVGPESVYADAVAVHGLTDAIHDVRFIGLLNQYGWNEEDWQAVRALGVSNACMRPGGEPYVAGGPTVGV